MGTNANGQATDRAGDVAVYGTPEHMAQLFASVAQLTDREPDRTFEDEEVRNAARQLAGLIHVRLAGTSRSE